MLLRHLLLKNTKTQITLLLQWQRITINVIRPSSSSSDSSSDSDTDSGSLNKNKDDTSKYTTHSNAANVSKNVEKNERGIDYLCNIRENYKRKKIEKHLSKAAQMLTATGQENKEKVLSTLLENIANIQNEDRNVTPKRNINMNERNRSENTHKYEKQNIRRKQKNEGRNTGAQLTPKDSPPKKPSIIRMLQDHQKKNIAEKYINRDPAEPSIIKTLKIQQEVQGSSDRRVPKNNERNEKEPSVIRILQNQRKKLKTISAHVEKEPHLQEPSVIRILQDQQKSAEIDNNNIKIQTQDGPFGLKMLKSRQKKAEGNDNKEKSSTLNEPSVIKMLQSQQKKAQSSDYMVKSETRDEASVTKMLQNRMMKSRFAEAKQGIQEINELISDRHNEPVTYEKIFTNDLLQFNPAVPELKMWNICEQRELKSSVIKYPENAFQEMIKWTEEGKLWKFPIDNEQGMEEEQNVHFSKHVFLERHLAEWCPPKGPMRHFMELVCVGLAKNPYLTFEEKYDHIMWYRDYFKDKEGLLQKLGLIE